MFRLTAFLLLAPAVCLGSVFDSPEVRVSPSPAMAAQMHLPAGARVSDHHAPGKDGRRLERKPVYTSIRRLVAGPRPFVPR